VTPPVLWCVVPAAGRGVRAGGDRPKQYQLLAGRPLIEHTLERLAAHPRIAGLLVTLAADDRHWSGLRTLHGKPVLSATGGARRSESVLAPLGLKDRMLQLADELTNQYVVQYGRPEQLIPPEKVQVTVNQPGLTVRARTTAADK